MPDWKEIALHAELAAQLIRANGCTCHDRFGDEYYCSVHGGEGCWVDLKVKSDMLVEKIEDWIANQNDEVKQSAEDAFGTELEMLKMSGKMYRAKG